MGDGLETTRESVILQFETELDRVRTMRLPNPDPEIDVNAVRGAAGLIIMAAPFDNTGTSSGMLMNLYRAMHERETTRVLI